jgi:hypothetical protein
MNHTAIAPDSDSHGEVTKIAPVANPRRTRLGADGNPLARPVAPTSN